MRTAPSLLLTMSILIRRPAASAFVQHFCSSSSRRSFHAGSAAMLCPRACPPSLQTGIRYSMATTTSLNLLSRTFTTGPINDEQSHTTNNDALQSSKNDDAEYYQPIFKAGDQVMVEVIYFGPLGASVDIVAHNSHDPSNCIPQDEPALGRGMILQREIDYFRRGRGGLDVLKDEILPAYIEKVREEKRYNDDIGEEVEELLLDISLRPPGGKAKAQELGEQILEKLKSAEDGVLDVGDKSSPEDINEMFPGASKGAFKKAVSALYKRGLVTPGPTSVTLK